MILEPEIIAHGANELRTSQTNCARVEITAHELNESRTA
jgi:hypothetical protein